MSGLHLGQVALYNGNISVAGWIAWNRPSGGERMAYIGQNTVDLDFVLENNTNLQIIHPGGTALRLTGPVNQDRWLNIVGMTNWLFGSQTSKAGGLLWWNGQDRMALYNNGDLWIGGCLTVSAWSYPWQLCGSPDGTLRFGNQMTLDASGNLWIAGGAEISNGLRVHGYTTLDDGQSLTNWYVPNGWIYTRDGININGCWWTSNGSLLNTGCSISAHDVTARNRLNAGDAVIAGHYLRNYDGWFYTESLRGNQIYSDGNVSGQNVYARNGVNVNECWLTNENGVLTTGCSFSAHDIYARNNLDVGNTLYVANITGRNNANVVVRNGMVVHGLGGALDSLWSMQNFHCWGNEGRFENWVYCANFYCTNLANVGSVSSRGNISANGNLTVNGAATIYGPITANSTVTAHGAITANAGIWINNSNLVIGNGMIQCTHGAEFGGTLIAAGLASLIDMECGLDLVVHRNLTVLGNLDVYGIAFIPNLSDRRTKAFEIQYERSLDTIRLLNPNSYEYNGLAHTPTGRTFISVTANDVIDIMPEIVGKRTIDDEEYLTVEPAPVTWALVNAVKELDRENAELKQRITALETRS